MSEKELNTQTLKNIAYLHAIQHGAQLIHEFSDEISLETSLINSFSFEKINYGLIYDGNDRLVNVYAHFGQPNLWPRGFPSTQAHQPHQNFYICGKRVNFYIQQSLINSNPDIDDCLKAQFKYLFTS